MSSQEEDKVNLKQPTKKRKLYGRMLTRKLELKVMKLVEIVITRDTNVLKLSMRSRELES